MNESTNQQSNQFISQSTINSCINQPINQTLVLIKQSSAEYSGSVWFLEEFLAAAMETGRESSQFCQQNVLNQNAEGEKKPEIWSQTCIFASVSHHKKKLNIDSYYQGDVGHCLMFGGTKKFLKVVEGFGNSHHFLENCSLYFIHQVFHWDLLVL